MTTDDPSIKSFSTRTLLTVATGRGVTGATFGDVHEAIEHLIGEPVWTHQLASPEPWAKARGALVAQCPKFADADGDGLGLACEGKDGPDRERAADSWARAEVARIGAESFDLVKGNGRGYDAACADAISGLVEIGKPMIVVGIDA